MEWSLSGGSTEFAGFGRITEGLFFLEFHLLFCVPASPQIAHFARALSTLLSGLGGPNEVEVDGSGTFMSPLLLALHLRSGTTAGMLG